jgi:hypothetical protein
VPVQIFDWAGAEGGEIFDVIESRVFACEIDCRLIELVSIYAHALFGAGEAEETGATIQIQYRVSSIRYQVWDHPPDKGGRGVWLEGKIFQNLVLELGGHEGVRLEERVGVDEVAQTVYFFAQKS